jgi:hypothetical protein
VCGALTAILLLKALCLLVSALFGRFFVAGRGMHLVLEGWNGAGWQDKAFITLFWTLTTVLLVVNLWSLKKYGISLLGDATERNGGHQLSKREDKKHRDTIGAKNGLEIDEYEEKKKELEAIANPSCPSCTRVAREEACPTWAAWEEPLTWVVCQAEPRLRKSTKCLLFSHQQG